MATTVRSASRAAPIAAATLQTWKKASSTTESVVLESVERLRHNTLDVVQTHSTVLEAAADGELVSLDSLISAVGQSVSYAKHPSCVLHLLGRLMMKSILPSLVYSVSILLTIIREHLALVQVYLHLNVITSITPLVSTLVYKDVVAAANLNNLFCQ